ncbi:MAG: energy transducer TonB [candidate division WOR-3 bacterium]
MAQLFEEKGLRGIDISVVVSVVLHAALLLLFSRATPRPRSTAEDLKQVTFMDVTYRPEVAQLMPKASFSGGGSNLPEAPVPTYASGVAAEEVPAIDMSATLERDQSQASIDLDRYELDRGEGGMDVIRLGGSGSGKSTEEILAQPKVELARGLGGRGSGPGLPGLAGYPGVAQPQAQLSIEHRALEKPAARALPQMPTQDLPKVEAPVAQGSQFMIAGPISQRQINRKVVPKYPRWALDRRISGTVVVRIWVLPNGQVKGTPTVETSSGYPDLDQVVVDALRGWEFAPLGPGVKAEDQWGVITFKFALS